MTRYQYKKIELPASYRDWPYPRHIAEILYRRGFKTWEDAYYSLKILYDYMNYNLSGVKKAVAILKDAKEVAVYRDYDCDGISAGALLLKTLSCLGIKAYDYANEREVDGYGMCIHGVDTIRKLYPNCDTILTCDNGISAIEAVDYAKSLGFKVIITDHHEPGDVIPRADAVIDPKKWDDPYPFREICGTEVAFKLLYALCRDMNAGGSTLFDGLDIVALATVADVMPLIDENRTLVMEGLGILNKDGRPFFKVFKKILKKDKLKASDLAFYVAPAINALSRMGEDTGLAVKALLTDDEEEAERLVQKLISVNNERKELTNEEYEKVLETAEFGSCIIVSGDFSEGIVGILAGRLTEEYGCPALVISNTGKGSGRSTDDFHLKYALDDLPKGLLKGYGGHAKAAGFTVEDGKIDEFKKAFRALTDKVLPMKPEKLVKVDCKVKDSELDIEFVKAIDELEPFGEGFEAPVFKLLADVQSVYFMGSEGQHVKLMSTNGIPIIKWNGAKDFKEAEFIPSKFIGAPSINVWNGKESVQFIVSDFLE